MDDLRRLDFALGSAPAWEPPLDLIETENEVLAYIALPGVDISSVEVTAESGTLVVRGERVRPPERMSAAILRLELPWGPFRRQVSVPGGCTVTSREAERGYLVIRLAKPGRDAS
ncbi:Hsp20/alpha crystallin family protein [Rhodophyticola sp. MJ-SS7]|nr:Hsp20/alpha crystallin family protein [Rhodophyticola sp. MJ-SS7]